MTSSTLPLASATFHKVAGTGENAETRLTARRPVMADDYARLRAQDPRYFEWLRHVTPAAGCTRPIRLSGEKLTADASTGELLSLMSTADMPDGLIYKACGNRRASVCPSCSYEYAGDMWQLLQAGGRRPEGRPGVGAVASAGLRHADRARVRAGARHADRVACQRGAGHHGAGRPSAGTADRPGAAAFTARMIRGSGSRCVPTAMTTPTTRPSTGGRPSCGAGSPSPCGGSSPVGLG